MRVDWRSLLRASRPHLKGRPAPAALPPQRGLWGWIRAALAFQPAHPQPADESALDLDSVSLLGQIHARPPAGDLRESIEQRFRRGSVMPATGRYQDAVTILSAVLEETPEHALALASRAAACRMLKHNELAILDASRALELQPDLAWAYATRGAIHRLQKNYPHALADLDKAIELQPDYEWCIAGRGETYRLMGRTDAALIDLNRALELNPRNDWALMCRVAVYLDTQDDQTAHRVFREAVNALPDGDWALSLAALTYRLMGKDLTRYADAPQATAPPLTRPARRGWFNRRQPIHTLPGIPLVYISRIEDRLYLVEDATSTQVQMVKSPRDVLAATAAILQTA